MVELRRQSGQIRGLVDVNDLQARTKLLLAIEPEVTNNNHQLADEGDPENRESDHALANAVREAPLRCVGEDLDRSLPIRCDSSGDDDNHSAKQLRECESSAHMETGKRLFVL